jgi:DNA topoisomerase-1
MAKALVVVESPAKAKTINKYLGRDYKVMASMGHVRDLPKSKLGVDVDDDFEPVYEVIPSRKKVLTELRSEAKKADEIYLATDPDREGEAIGWHLAEELGTGKRKKVRRLMFNEITKKAVMEALRNPSDIDMKMVDAQQARRVLDRLVGYKISPLLWEKVRRGLSAGRVQSVALKLVCDREREIESFTPEEYWNLFARLGGAVPPEFEAKLAKRGGSGIKIANQEEADAILASLRGATWIVSSISTRERRKNALPPFITSKLQQASRFPVKKTMMIAQQLYEGIEVPGEGSVGLITYMRTDSTRVSEQALDEVRAHVAQRFGAEYVPERANVFRAKSDAQDAHEAIRPTSMQYEPETVRAHLTGDQYYLYRLIWNRFVASQMPAAVFDDTTVEIAAGDEFVFRVKGSVPKFAGWMAVYNIEVATEQKDEGKEGPGPDAVSAEDEDATGSGVLPPLAEGDRLELRELRPEQKFTQPPPRYSEATLVKALEENGIGRPSTYAQIITVLQAREYVNKIEGRFKPTMLGRILVEKLLSPTFDDILDVDYTRKLEDQLDEIEQGKQKYESTLKSFYRQFKKDLAEAKKRMPDIKVEGMPPEPPVVCDKCGSPMVIKAGKFGLFLACSAYPECENTRELEAPEQSTDEISEECENCGKPMVVKRGRFGQFLACTGYPECKTTRKLLNTKQGLTAAKPDQILEERCPECGSNLVVKQGRYGEFTACTGYPGCRYVKHKTTGVMCPKGDGGELVERKSRRGKVFYGCNKYPDCDFTLWNKPVLEPCPECKAPFLVEKVTKRHGRQLICNTEGCTYVRSAELEPVGS